MSSSVELATAYLNPSPQLNAHANQLRIQVSQGWQDPDPKTQPTADTAGRPWALNRRLTKEIRAAIVTAYQAGTRQQTLADRYGISLSSIKRLLRATR